MIKTGIIYYLADPDFPNEPKYVGKTIQKLKKRLRGHINDSKKKNTLIANWIKFLIKNNKQPVIIILEENIVSFDYLNLLEQYWISQFKTWKFILKNHTEGGEGSFGYIHTQETKDKISRKKIGKPGTTLGRKRPPEECKKLSKIHKGKKLSETHNKKLHESNIGNKYTLGMFKKPIIQYDLNGNFIKEWDSVTDASQILNLNYSAINNCVNNRLKTSGGFVWKHKEKMEFHISKIE